MALNQGETSLFINGNDPKTSIVDDFMYGSNVASSHVSIRLGFLRKVYGILSAQLAFTTIVSSIVMYARISEFFQENSWIMILNMVMTLGVLVYLMAKRKEYPLNYYLLATFTVLQSLTIGTFASAYETWTVIQAFFMTTVIVVCLTCYTLQSKRDFNSMAAILFTGLTLLIIAGIMQIFLQSSFLQFSLALMGAFLFCAFVIFDTHMIMKTLSAEEYIVGVINLYLDIVNLFLEVLKIIDGLKK